MITSTATATQASDAAASAAPARRPRPRTTIQRPSIASARPTSSFVSAASAAVIASRAYRRSSAAQMQ